MSNSKDFKDICELAGRDSRYVFEKIRRKILEKNGWNVDLSLRMQPRRRRQMRKNKKKTFNRKRLLCSKNQRRNLQCIIK